MAKRFAGAQAIDATAREMSFSKLVHHFPGEERLTIIDVGSAGGLHRRWRPFAPIISAVLFDPREEQATGALMRGGCRVYPVALGRQAGTATLNILALPNMSSTLLPNRALLSQFRKKDAHSQIVGREEFVVEPLDAIAARDGFTGDIIKIDTQGSELEILRGAIAMLTKDVLIAEIEVSFMQRYLDQPFSDEIFRYMRELGFDAIELSRLKRYRAKNTAGIANISLGLGQRSGRVAYGDALFLIEEARLLERAEATNGVALAKAILGLTAYGKPDIAARLIDIGGHTLDESTRDGLKHSLRQLCSARGGLRYLHVVSEWLREKI